MSSQERCSAEVSLRLTSSQRPQTTRLFPSTV